MIPITATQFHSALDCANDHGTEWTLHGHPADEIGAQVAVALWYPTNALGPNASMPWLRCDVTSNGQVYHYISSGVPLDVWEAAEVTLRQ